MTCADFERNSKTVSPHNASNALVSAMVVHAATCPKCRGELNVRADEVAKTLSPENKLVGELLAAQTVARVIQDPEAVEPIAKAVRERPFA
jgi:hypothetical protein